LKNRYLVLNSSISEHSTLVRPLEPSMIGIEISASLVPTLVSY